MGRVPRYLARRFAGYAALAAVVVGAVAGALAPALRAERRPAPWVLTAAAVVLGAVLARRRSDRSGEVVAVAAAGRSPWAAAAPGVALAALLLAGAGIGAPARADAPAVLGVVRGVQGELLGAGADGMVLLDRAGRLVRVAAPPPGFAVEPTDRARLRRRLLVLGSLWQGSGHPLDPSALRWVLAVAVVGAAWTVLAARTAARAAWWLLVAAAAFAAA